MTKEEIKDIIELNYDYNLNWLVDYFYKIYQDKKGVNLGNSQYDTDDIEKMKVRRNK